MFAVFFMYIVIGYVLSIGALSVFQLVLSRMGDKLDEQEVKAKHRK